MAEKEEKKEIEERETKSEKDIMERPMDLLSGDLFPRSWVDRSMAEMERMLEDFDRTFNKMVGRPIMRRRPSLIPEFRTPALDVQNKGDHYLIEAELPGINKKDITVELKGDRLTLKGEKKKEEKEEGENYVRQERGYSSFYREIPLPDDVIEDDVDASLKNGVLAVKLPKTEKEAKEGKKIEVK
ncbi:MAG: Hsp20/alpha crystallin family protein [Thermoplasmata archaeon]